ARLKNYVACIRLWQAISDRAEVHPLKYEVPVKNVLSLCLVLCFSAPPAFAREPQAKPATALTAPAASSQTQKNIEAYLRNLYAFGPDVQLVVGPPKETPIEGLLETTIDLTIEANKQTVKFYVSKDGRFLFRGEMSDLTKDPLAEARAEIQMND